MKTVNRVLSSVIVLILILSVCPITAFAQSTIISQLSIDGISAIRDADGEKVTILATDADCGSYYLCVALYNSHGEMLDIKAKNVELKATQTKLSVQFDTYSSAETAKAFFVLPDYSPSKYSETNIIEYANDSIAVLKQKHSSKSISSVSDIEAFSNHWYAGTNDITADLSDALGLIYSLTVSDATSFSSTPATYDRDELIEWGKDPGLGIGILHEFGYDGEGAVIAYVDQPLAQPFHDEYTNINLHYINTVTDGGGENSMHGPAVLSLLAGEECGTAPGAEVYYYAHASWKADQTTHANCLYQIIEKNKTLSENDRIRMVAFSDNIDDSEANADAFRTAVKACEDAGIMVWFCGEYSSGSFLPLSDKADPENFVKASWGSSSPELVFVPAGSRTTAATMGDANYIYWSDGGLSWTMPYMLGVYSIALSIDSSLTQSDIRSLIVSTAYTNSSGMRIVNPVEFIAVVLERVDKSTEANELRDAYANSRNYIYTIMDTAQLSTNDLTSIADYLSSLSNASVVVVDAASYANATSIYDAIKSDHANRGGKISGIQIFGTTDMVPAFPVKYKVQMLSGVDDCGTFLTDIFYGNLNNSSSTIGASYNVCDQFANSLNIDLIPDWPVVRLPLEKDEFSDYFERYTEFALNTELTKQQLVNFSNPIFASTNHIDDMGTFLNRLYSEFGIIDSNYTLYGNLQGQYPVTTSVQGGFTSTNLSTINNSCIAEFLINSHGQRNNIDCCYYINGEEQRESLINSTTINTVLGNNPYYLDCWTCNNAFGLKDNLVTSAMAGKCIGAFAATTIISNNGVNCNASFSELKQSNFYYFYYTYLKELNEGECRSQAFYAAQKEYGESLIADSKLGIRGDGNYQFNLYNLIAYENFGVIEPNVAVMALYKNNGYISQAGQSVPKDDDNPGGGGGGGYAKSDLTSGTPIGVSWTVAYSVGTDCSSPENYTIYGLSAQQLDNGYVRITLDYKAPAGMYVDAFNPPSGDRFMLYGDVSTGERQTFTYDVSYSDLSAISTVTMKFFGGGKQESECQYVFASTSSILSGFDESKLPVSWTVAYSVGTSCSSPENYTIYGLSAQQLDNGYVRITLDYKVPAGMYVDAFNPPSGDRFMLYGDVSTGERQTFTYDVSYNDLSAISTVTMKFFGGGKQESECQYVFASTSSILSGFDESKLP